MTKKNQKNKPLPSTEDIKKTTIRIVPVTRWRVDEVIDGHSSVHGGTVGEFYTEKQAKRVAKMLLKRAVNGVLE